jgi:hypothetical protein
VPDHFKTGLINHDLSNMRAVAQTDDLIKARLDRIRTERLGFHPYADDDMAAAFAPLLVRATQIMKDRVVIACFVFCIHIFETVSRLT